MPIQFKGFMKKRIEIRNLLIFGLFECLFRRQQMEDVDRNGSEDDDDEKPGKRVMGPRKKFMWDDKLR